MPGFTLDLDEEQQTVRRWLPEFAPDVIGPVASEWDEREETPWPVLQEAAKAGISSPDSSASAREDESGLSLPITGEELLGDRPAWTGRACSSGGPPGRAATASPSTTARAR